MHFDKQVRTQAWACAPCPCSSPCAAVVPLPPTPALFPPTPQGNALHGGYKVFPYTQEYPVTLTQKAAAAARRDAALPKGG